MQPRCSRIKKQQVQRLIIDTKPQHIEGVRSERHCIDTIHSGIESLFQLPAAADKVIGLNLHLWGLGSHIRSLIDISRLFITVPYTQSHSNCRPLLCRVHAWFEVESTELERDKARGRAREGEGGSSNMLYT